jgi:hypothetical protein
VAYDAAHNTWMIASLAISTSGGSVLGAAVIVNQSTNGGTTWSNAVVAHAASGSENLDKDWIVCDTTSTSSFYGHCYVEWDNNGGGNVIHMSTSSNGTTWSAVTRIPADAVGSGVDHFIPGLAVDKSTSGSAAHLVLAFYYYPVSSCSSSTCKLDIGYSSSTNGGGSWTSTTNITGPLTLSWLANTTQGRMVGDYMSTSFNGSGTAFPVFADASAPTGGSSCGSAGVTCNEGMFTVVTGLTIHRGLFAVANDPVVAGSDHAAAPGPLTSR